MQPTDSELVAFLDEALPAEQMAQLEQALRSDAALAQRLIKLRSDRDNDVHSVAEIWRKHRVSCPTREQLGSYLLGVLDDAHADFVKFHLTTAGCRVCQANVEDLQRQQAAEPAAAERKRRYFQSSAGKLRRGM